MEYIPNKNNPICDGSVYETDPISEFVVKIVPVSVLSRYKIFMEGSSLLHEIINSHPNLLPIIQTKCQEEEKTYWVVMEKMSGLDLFDYLNEVTVTMPEKLIWDITEKLLQGLAHLHKCGVIHRDIKPENIRIIQDRDKLGVIIYDFGLSVFTEQKTNIISGTIEFIAPELYFYRDGHLCSEYNELIDIWSLGITVFTMMALDTPCKLLGVDASDFSIFNNNKELVEILISRGYSQKLIDMCFDMLIVDNTQRLSAVELLEKYFTPVD